MIGGSGRCHGPNCTRTAVAEFFCGEACAGAWSRSHAGVPPLASEGLANIEVRFTASAVRRMPEVVETTLPAEVDPDSPTPPLPPADTTAAQPTLGEVLRIVESLPRMDPPEPAKLTREQFESLQRAFPGRPGWQPNTQVSAFDGVPVEIVESVEESTPYLLERERRTARRFIQLASNLPPTALVLGAGTFGVGATLAREAAEAERLTQAIRAICPPEHLEAALDEAARRPDGNGLQSVYDDLTRGWLPASTGATKQQVASNDPQVGFLVRAFHWLFGRTT